MSEANFLSSQTLYRLVIYLQLIHYMVRWQVYPSNHIIYLHCAFSRKFTSCALADSANWAFRIIDETYRKIHTFKVSNSNKQCTPNVVVGLFPRGRLCLLYLLKTQLYSTLQSQSRRIYLAKRNRYTQTQAGGLLDISVRVFRVIFLYVMY